jgi:hypothetical protein
MFWFYETVTVNAKAPGRVVVPMSKTKPMLLPRVAVDGTEKIMTT